MNQRHVTRKYIPGDRWMFVKIYGGQSTCDRLLVDVVYPIVCRLLRRGVICRWFFIRYADPEFHLRVRVELSTVSHMADALQAFKRRLAPLCRCQVLHKVTLDTYEPEIERYGLSAMDTTESLFGIDSHCVCRLLKELYRNGDESQRWQWALRWIDAFLEATGHDMAQKWTLISSMTEAYLAEFGYNEHNIKPLATRYRQLRDTITNTLDTTDAESTLQTIIKSHARQTQNLLRSTHTNPLNVSSLLHMSMNRLFASQNRTNELVLYYSLEKHYKSKLYKEQPTAITALARKEIR